MNEQLSISPTFYEQHFFVTKGICAAFLNLKFDFILFWQKKIFGTAALKMLLKLTTVRLKRLKIDKAFVALPRQTSFLGQN
jgi:hypothetical protein